MTNDIVKTNAPLVTIVTPNYNGSKFLEETILSVLNQTYDNIEYIIIDGGSKDQSVEIIKKYEKEIAYWISEPDKGMYSAINKGFNKANGQIYAYLNSDDLLFLDAVELVVKKFNETPFDFCYGNTEMIDQNTERLYRLKTPNMSRKLIKWSQRLPFNQQSCFYTANTFNEIGGFDESYRLSADYHFFYHYIIDNNYSLSRVNKTLGRFRFHTDTLSANFEKEMREETVRFLKEHKVFDSSTLGQAKRLFSEAIFKGYNLKKYFSYNLMNKITNG